jgi:hypothetical protein
MVLRDGLRHREKRCTITAEEVDLDLKTIEKIQIIFA